MSRDKRPDRAIEIARRTGLKLKLAAKIGDDDRAYFHEVVEPMIDGDRIEYVGEIMRTQKAEFLGNAAGLLFPIDWPEPFGLAVIEAMACGTPVIAWNCGAMPEIVDQGVTGFIVDSIEDAVASMPASCSSTGGRSEPCSNGGFPPAEWRSDYAAAYARLIDAPGGSKAS